MDKQYYISSTKFSIRERQTKRGKVYDVVFRIVEKQEGGPMMKLFRF